MVPINFMLLHFHSNQIILSNVSKGPKYISSKHHETSEVKVEPIGEQLIYFIEGQINQQEIQHPIVEAYTQHTIA